MKRPFGYFGKLLLLWFIGMQVTNVSGQALFQPARNRADLNRMLASLELQTSFPEKLEGGHLYHIRFRLEPEEVETAQKGGRIQPSFGILTLGIPDGFEFFKDQTHAKILFTSVTGDIYAPNAYSAGNYFSSTKKTDWFVLTVDADVWPVRDSVQWRVTLMAAAFRYLNEVFPPVRQAHLAYGGFSGGSKMSLYLALFSVRLGKMPVGLFLGGCNELPFDDAQKLLGIPVDQLEGVPVVLSIGELDKIAEPGQSERLAEKLKKRGIKDVRMLYHPGKHQLMGFHVEETLSIFDSGLRPLEEKNPGK